MKRLGHLPPQQCLPSLPTLDSRIVPGSQLLRTVIGFWKENYGQKSWNGITATGGRPFPNTEAQALSRRAYPAPAFGLMD